jgi:hypothetical protein
MKINIAKKTLISMLLLVSTLIPLSVFSGTVYAQDTSCDLNKTFLGIPTWYKYLEATEDSSGRCSPQLTTDSEGNEINSILPIGLAVLEAMIRLAGLLLWL